MSLLTKRIGEYKRNGTSSPVFMSTTLSIWRLPTRIGQLTVSLSEKRVTKFR